MRRFVMGDIHGNYKGLLQCLERSGFDKEKDQLIQLGDVCDGYAYVKNCVDELLSIKDLIVIKGNHDDWFLQFLELGTHAVDWGMGGLGTLKSYALANTRWKQKPKPIQGLMDYGPSDPTYITNLNPGDIPEDHIKFFKKQHNFYKDDDNNLFIHAGFNRHFPLSEQTPYIFYWDRDLFSCALSAKNTDGNYKLKFKEEFKNIFIGHTSTTNWKNGTLPIFADRVINIDTGSGWTGKLTIMDVDTKEYWQSDLCKELYPNEQGR